MPSWMITRHPYKLSVGLYLTPRVSNMKFQCRSLGLETVSRNVFGMSQSRLGLEKIWEGLSLVSNREPNVSVSDPNISFYKLISTTEVHRSY